MNFILNRQRFFFYDSTSYNYNCIFSYMTLSVFIMSVCIFSIAQAEIYTIAFISATIIARPHRFLFYKTDRKLEQVHS